MFPGAYDIMNPLSTDQHKTLSILIPAYNESRTIEELLDRILKVDLGHIDKEIIVIDDASTDNTAKIIESYINSTGRKDLRFISSPTNSGKGAAIRNGIEAATGDYIIIQDADLEYDPEDYNELLSPILAGEADVVYGSRPKGKKPHGSLFFWHLAGNRILTWLSNIFTGMNLTDMETCYKLFRSDILQKLWLVEKRFGFEPEVTAKISRIPGIRIVEVEISYSGRSYMEGKKITWKDGIRALYCIIKYNLFFRKTYRDDRHPKK